MFGTPSPPHTRHIPTIFSSHEQVSAHRHHRGVPDPLDVLLPDRVFVAAHGCYYIEDKGDAAISTNPRLRRGRWRRNPLPSWQRQGVPERGHRSGCLHPWHIHALGAQDWQSELTTADASPRHVVHYYHHAAHFCRVLGRAEAS